MRRFKFKAVTTVMAAGALALLANLSPAFAAGAGVTTGGYSTIHYLNSNPKDPLCAPVTSATITLLNEGTVQTASMTYTGPFTTTFTTGGFNFAPKGTYLSSNTTCGGAPQAITLTSGTFAGSFTDPVTKVVSTLSCTFTSGSYTRDANVYTIDVMATCGTANDPAHFVFSGNENPCLGGVIPADNCAGALNDTEFQGSYRQT